jgi:hypothetical protein
MNKKFAEGFLALDRFQQALLENINKLAAKPDNVPTVTVNMDERVAAEHRAAMDAVRAEANRLDHISSLSKGLAAAHAPVVAATDNDSKSAIQPHEMEVVSIKSTLVPTLPLYDNDAKISADNPVITLDEYQAMSDAAKDDLVKAVKAMTIKMKDASEENPKNLIHPSQRDMYDRIVNKNWSPTVRTHPYNHRHPAPEAQTNDTYAVKYPTYKLLYVGELVDVMFMPEPGMTAYELWCCYAVQEKAVLGDTFSFLLERDLLKYYHYYEMRTIRSTVTGKVIGEMPVATRRLTDPISYKEETP